MVATTPSCINKTKSKRCDVKCVLNMERNENYLSYFIEETIRETVQHDRPQGNFSQSRQPVPVGLIENTNLTGNLGAPRPSPDSFRLNLPVNSNIPPVHSAFQINNSIQVQYQFPESDRFFIQPRDDTANYNPVNLGTPAHLIPFPPLPPRLQSETCSQRTAPFPQLPARPQSETFSPRTADAEYTARRVDNQDYSQFNVTNILNRDIRGFNNNPATPPGQGFIPAFLNPQFPGQVTAPGQHLPTPISYNQAFRNNAYPAHLNSLPNNSEGPSLAGNNIEALNYSKKHETVPVPEPYVVTDSSGFKGGRAPGRGRPRNSRLVYPNQTVNTNPKQSTTEQTKTSPKPNYHAEANNYMKEFLKVDLDRKKRLLESNNSSSGDTNRGGKAVIGQRGSRGSAVGRGKASSRGGSSSGSDRPTRGGGRGSRGKRGGKHYSVSILVVESESEDSDIICVDDDKPVKKNSGKISANQSLQKNCNQSACNQDSGVIDICGSSVDGDSNENKPKLVSSKLNQHVLPHVSTDNVGVSGEKNRKLSKGITESQEKNSNTSAESEKNWLEELCDDESVTFEKEKDLVQSDGEFDVNADTEMDELDTSNLMCSVCAAIFDSREEFDKHADTHSSNMCSICAAIFDTREAFDKHMVESHVGDTDTKDNVIEAGEVNRALINRVRERQFLKEANEIEKRSKELRQAQELKKKQAEEAKRKEEEKIKNEQLEMIKKAAEAKKARLDQKRLEKKAGKLGKKAGIVDEKPGILDKKAGKLDKKAGKLDKKEGKLAKKAGKKAGNNSTSSIKKIAEGKDLCSSTVSIKSKAMDDGMMATSKPAPKSRKRQREGTQSSQTSTVDNSEDSARKNMSKNKPRQPRSGAKNDLMNPSKGKRKRILSPRSAEDESLMRRFGIIPSKVQLDNCLRTASADKSCTADKDRLTPSKAVPKQTKPVQKKTSIFESSNAYSKSTDFDSIFKASTDTSTKPVQKKTSIFESLSADSKSTDFDSIFKASTNTSLIGSKKATASILDSGITAEFSDDSDCELIEQPIDLIVLDDDDSADSASERKSATDCDVSVKSSTKHTRRSVAANSVSAEKQVKGGNQHVRSSPKKRNVVENTSGGSSQKSDSDLLKAFGMKDVSINFFKAKSVKDCLKMDKKGRPGRKLRSKRTSEVPNTKGVASGEGIGEMSKDEMDKLLAQCGMGISVPVASNVVTPVVDRDSDKVERDSVRSPSPVPSTSTGYAARTRLKRTARKSCKDAEIMSKFQVKESAVLVKSLSNIELSMLRNPHSSFGKSSSWLRRKFDTDSDSEHMDWDIPADLGDFSDESDVESINTENVKGLGSKFSRSGFKSTHDVDNELRKKFGLSDPMVVIKSKNREVNQEKSRSLRKSSLIGRECHVASHRAVVSSDKDVKKTSKTNSDEELLKKFGLSDLKVVVMDARVKDKEGISNSNRHTFSPEEVQMSMDIAIKNVFPKPKIVSKAALLKAKNRPRKCLSGIRNAGGPLSKTGKTPRSLQKQSKRAMSVHDNKSLSAKRSQQGAAVQRILRKTYIYDKKAQPEMRAAKANASKNLVQNARLKMASPNKNLSIKTFKAKSALRASQSPESVANKCGGNTPVKDNEQQVTNKRKTGSKVENNTNSGVKRSKLSVMKSAMGLPAVSVSVPCLSVQEIEKYTKSTHSKNTDNSDETVVDEEKITDKLDESRVDEGKSTDSIDEPEFYRMSTVEYPEPVNSGGTPPVSNTQDIIEALTRKERTPVDNLSQLAKSEVFDNDYESNESGIVRDEGNDSGSGYELVSSNEGNGHDNVSTSTNSPMPDSVQYVTEALESVRDSLEDADRGNTVKNIDQRKESNNRGNSEDTEGIIRSVKVIDGVVIREEKSCKDDKGESGEIDGDSVGGDVDYVDGDVNSVDGDVNSVDSVDGDVNSVDSVDGDVNCSVKDAKDSNTIVINTDSEAYPTTVSSSDESDLPSLASFMTSRDQSEAVSDSLGPGGKLDTDHETMEVTADTCAGEKDGKLDTEREAIEVEAMEVTADNCKGEKDGKLASQHEATEVTEDSCAESESDSDMLEQENINQQPVLCRIIDSETDTVIGEVHGYKENSPDKVYTDTDTTCTGNGRQSLVAADNNVETDGRKRRLSLLQTATYHDSVDDSIDTLPEN